MCPSPYSPDKFEIGVLRQNGTSNVGMMLTQRSGLSSYAVFDDEYLAAQFFTGVPGYASLPSEKELSVRQESWRAGLGLDIYDADEPERYYLSRGMDLRFRGMGIAGPKATALPTNAIFQPPDIVNPNMELYTGWSVNAYSTDAYQGSLSQHLYVNGVTGAITNTSYQDIVGWAPGATYVLYTYVKTNIDGGDDVYVVGRVGLNDGVTNTWTGNISGDTNWAQYSVSKALASNATRLRIYFESAVKLQRDNQYSTRFDQVTIVGNQVNSLGVCRSIQDFNDKLYFGMNENLVCLNSAGSGFNAIGILPSNITSLEPFTDSQLYIAQNISTPYRAINTGDYVSTAGVGVNTFQFFKTVHSASPTMWGNDGAATIRSCLTPSNANSWSGQTDVGSNYHNITDLLTKSGALYIMKEDMPYYLDSTGAVKNDLAPKLQALIAATSGKNSYTDGDKIYIPCGSQALLEIDGSTLTWRSPSDFCTNLPQYNGRVQALAADDQWLFAAINYGSTTIEILAGRLETIGNSTQWVWHSIAELELTGVEKMYVSSVYQKRLYIASTESDEPVYYIPLPSGYGDVANDTNRSFQTNTWFETPWLHAEFRDSVKAFPQITALLGHAYNSNVFFNCYYKKLEDTAWTAVADLTGNANTRVATSFLPDDASSNKPKSTMVRFRFIANTAYTDKTPILLGYNVQGLLYANRREIIACTVRCADEVTLRDGTIDHASKETIEDTIGEMIAAQWPVTFYDIEGNQKYVKPLPLPSSTPRWTVGVGEKSRKLEKYYNLLLQIVELS